MSERTAPFLLLQKMKLRVLLVTVTLLVEVTWGEDIIRTHLNEVADHLIADNYLHKSVSLIKIFLVLNEEHNSNRNKLCS